MTRNSKIRIGVALFIGMMLIVSISIYLRIVLSQERMSFAILMIAGVLIALAILSIFMTYRKISKEGYEKDLNGKYLELYERVKEFLEHENISKKSREEIKEEVLDIILNSQKEMRNPDEIFGENFEKAIENWVESYGTSNKVITLMIDSLMLFCVFMISMHLLNYIENLDIGFFKVEIDNYMFIYISLLTFVMVPFARVFSRKGKYLLYIGIPVILAGLFIAFTEISFRFLPDSSFTRWYNEGSMNLISSPFILFAFIAMAVFLFIIKRMIRKTVY